jgi:hypothetical protein
LAGEEPKNGGSDPRKGSGGPSHHILLHQVRDIELFELENGDFEQIRQAGQSIWKDLCLLSVPLAIPCVLNVAGEVHSQSAFSPTLSIFFNSLFGGVGFVLSLLSGFMWFKTYKSLDSTIERIKTERRTQSHESSLS